MISQPKRALWERALARAQQEFEAQIKRVRGASQQDRSAVFDAEQARNRVVFDAFKRGRLSPADIAAALGTGVREARRIIETAAVAGKTTDEL